MRVQMGGSYSYSQPNFSILITVCCTILSQTELLKKNPVSESVKQMSTHKTIINALLEDNSNLKDYALKLKQMCTNNYEMSRKVAKILLKQIN